MNDTVASQERERLKVASKPLISHATSSLFPRAGYAYGLMLLSAISFSTMSACGHGARTHTDWRLVVIARAGLNFLLALGIAYRNNIRLLWPGPRTLWIRSVIGSMGMLCTFYALTHLPVSTAVTLLNTFPLWLALLAWPVLRQKPTFSIWISLIVGLTGVYLIAQSYQSDHAEQGFTQLGLVLALMGAVSTAVVLLGLHRLRHLEAAAIVVHFSGFATFLAITYSVVTVRTGQPIDFSSLNSTTTLALLLAVGITSTAGQMFMTTAFQHGPPEPLAVLGLTQVVFSLVYDVIFWGHAIHGVELCGMALVGASAVWLVSCRRA